MANTNSAWAATIHCPTVPGTNQCNGTNFPDDMLGTAKDDDMDGLLVMTRCLDLRVMTK